MISIKRVPLTDDERRVYKLSDTQLCKVPYDSTSHESWLYARKSGLGGSDIAAVMELNPYISRLQVYKTKQPEYVERPPSVAMRKGIAMEEYVFKNYVVPDYKERGYKVVKPTIMFSRATTPWLHANLDGLAIPRNSRKDRHEVVEIKYVTEYGESAWGDTKYNGIPAQYYAQVQSYLWTMDAHKAIVYALFESTWTVKCFEIFRNDFFISDMLDTGREFWNTYVFMGIPPRPTLISEPLDFAKTLEELKAEKDVDPEMERICDRVRDLKAKIKAYEADISMLTKTLGDMALDGKYTPRFSVSMYTTSRIDTEKLHHEFPEAAAACTKQTVSTRTNIK